MSIYIHKAHNVSVLLYHLVCVAKGRQLVISTEVDAQLKQICQEISQRYEMHFVEIGADGDHVHFLIQSVPTYSPTKIARTVKSILARELLKRVAGLRESLWGAQFWTDGYFVNSVGRSNSETVIQKYIRNQGRPKDYVQISKDQLRLF
ncbi:MAG: IS200/IS605 family transposase [Patescibacteria group bacterium]|nr:IS200/IS605 family transposase [Patescibacteria group bacterium]MCL4390058.1 IS200/IS605 family transposase [Patescibacteria group bacterium]MCL5431627.1 IS200/IS605 family transposase [Patescibacteria group bacterium]MCL5431638.1 IS200/IS605 family transposase [Patescibacteria group bacterium]MCL5431841.1 IS200/IS605 family transposase [Patescibacteria group bacterium]